MQGIVSIKDMTFVRIESILNKGKLREHFINSWKLRIMNTIIADDCKKIIYLSDIKDSMNYNLFPTFEY